MSGAEADPRLRFSGLPRRAVPAALAVAAALVLATALTAPTAAQSYARGQNVAAVYEGWERNDDGSFNLVFGYMNRNWEEDLDVPVGPENNIEPGGPDQGQPTHFFPRRNRFVFRVRVPADFGDAELVWTLTTRGKTYKAYATLNPDYFIDKLVLQANVGAAGAAATSPDFEPNTPPRLVIEGGSIRQAKVGEPLRLAATVTDDGLPHARPLPATDPQFPTRSTTDSATGLRLSWFVYRGPGDARFDPPQIKVWEDTRAGQNSPWSPGWSTPEAPEEGRWETAVTFGEAGEYLLRCQAQDGGLATARDLRVFVAP